MQESEIRSALGRYKFYHVIKLTDTIFTPGWTDPNTIDIINMVIKGLRSLEIKDARVLDIGCRDGIFSFEAEKLGAREVIGIDNDLSRAAIEFLIPYFNSRVKLESLNLYDLHPQQHGLFDVICFSGVLYHLRYPFWGLRCIREVLKPGGHLVMHTAMYVNDNKFAMLFCPIGDECPGDDPTHCTNFNLKGLVDTLYSLGITVRNGEYLGVHGLVAPSAPAAAPRGGAGRLSNLLTKLGFGTRLEKPMPVAKHTFDERFYFDSHPDLKAALETSRWRASGYTHYKLHGRAERRLARLLDGTVIPPDQPVEFPEARINHAVFVCQYTPEIINPLINRYWETTHDVHNTAPNESFGSARMFPTAEPVRMSMYQRDSQT